MAASDTVRTWWRSRSVPCSVVEVCVHKMLCPRVSFEAAAISACVSACFHSVKIRRLSCSTARSSETFCMAWSFDSVSIPRKIATQSKKCDGKQRPYLHALWRDRTRERISPQTAAFNNNQTSSSSEDDEQYGSMVPMDFEIPEGLLKQTRKSLLEALEIAKSQGWLGPEDEISEAALFECVNTTLKEMLMVPMQGSTDGVTRQSINGELHVNTAVLASGLRQSAELSRQLFLSKRSVHDILQVCRIEFAHARSRNRSKQERRAQTKNAGSDLPCGGMRQSARDQEAARPSYTAPGGGGWWRAARSKCSDPGKGVPPVCSRSAGGELMVKVVAPVDAPLIALLHAALNHSPPPFTSHLANFNGAEPEPACSCVASEEVATYSLNEIEQFVYIGAVWVRKYKQRARGKAGLPTGYLLSNMRWERNGRVRAGSIISMFPSPRRFAPVPPPGALSDSSMPPVNTSTAAMSQPWCAWWSGRVKYRDVDYVVVDKPAGVPCQPVGSNSRECVPRLLSAALGCKLYPLHRLDLWTTGCLIFATSRKAAGKFNSFSDNSQTADLSQPAAVHPLPINRNSGAFVDQITDLDDIHDNLPQAGHRKTYKVLTLAPVPTGRFSHLLAFASEVVPAEFIAHEEKLPIAVLVAQTWSTPDCSAEGSTTVVGQHNSRTSGSTIKHSETLDCGIDGSDFASFSDMCGAAQLRNTQLQGSKPDPGGGASSGGTGTEEVDSVHSDPNTAWRLAELLVVQCEHVLVKESVIFGRAGGLFRGDTAGGVAKPPQDAMVRCYESEVQLVTGRTHQVRAQLAALGAPLVGDSLYNSLCGLVLASPSTRESEEALPPRFQPSELEVNQRYVDEGNVQNLFLEPGDMYSGAPSQRAAYVKSDNQSVACNYTGNTIADKTQFFLRAVKNLRGASSQNGYIGLHASRVCFMGQMVEADPAWWRTGS